MNRVQNSLNQMAKGAGILLIGSIFAKIINYFYRGYLARMLSVSDFGMLNLVIMIITFIIAIATLGMESGLNRYVPYYRGLDAKNKIAGVIYFSAKYTLIISILVTLAVFLFSGHIASLFEDSYNFSILLMILSISIPFTVVGNRIFLNCLLFFKYIKEYSFIFNILQHALRLILTITVVFFGYRIFGAAVAYTLSAIAIGIYSFYIFNSKFKLKKVYFDEKSEFLKYSTPLFLVAIFGYLY